MIRLFERTFFFKPESYIIAIKYAPSCDRIQSTLKKKDILNPSLSIARNLSQQSNGI